MPIRVLIADDSPFVCRMLTTHLHATPGFQVVGKALNGLRAVELVKQLKPDAVTLDLEMPEMDGLEALKLIMRECPTPVIMLSGISREAAEITLEAIKLGAVDFILKYTPGIDTDPEVLRREIVAKVRAASKVKVIRSLADEPFKDLGSPPLLLESQMCGEVSREGAKARRIGRAEVTPLRDFA